MSDEEEDVFRIRGAMQDIKTHTQGGLTMHNLWKFLSHISSSGLRVEGEYGMMSELAKCIDIDEECEISGYLRMAEATDEDESFRKEIEVFSSFRTVDDLVAGKESVSSCLSQSGFDHILESVKGGKKYCRMLVTVPCRECECCNKPLHFLNMFLKGDGRMRLVEVVSVRNWRKKQMLEAYAFSEDVYGPIRDLLSRILVVETNTEDSLLPKLIIASNLSQKEERCKASLSKILDEVRGFSSLSSFQSSFPAVRCMNRTSFRFLLNLRHFSQLNGRRERLCSLSNMLTNVFTEITNAKERGKKKICAIIKSRICCSLWRTVNESSFDVESPVLVFVPSDSEDYVSSPLRARNFVYFHPDMIHLGMTFYVDTDFNLLFLGFSKMARYTSALVKIRSRFESASSKADLPASLLQDRDLEETPFVQKKAGKERIVTRVDKPFTPPGPSHRSRKEKKSPFLNRNAAKRQAQKEESLERVRHALEKKKMDKKREEELFLSMHRYLQIGDAILDEGL